MSRELIQKYSISAKKSLGQNFLVNEDKVQEIADCIDVMGSDVVEVGPGYGVLSERLLEKNPRALHLVELDRDMIRILEERKQQGELDTGDTDFQIHNIDILKYVPNFQIYNVIANIPYYITSPILRHFLYELENTPENMVILMQRDVGDKILGKRKNKSSVLSLMIEKKCSVEEKILVPKESFVPQPKVESSVLLFQKHDTFEGIDDTGFLELIKKGFSEPRKKLIKNLVKGGYNKDTILSFFGTKGYDENLRGEDMSITEWCELFQKI